MRSSAYFFSVYEVRLRPHVPPYYAHTMTKHFSFVGYEYVLSAPDKEASSRERGKTTADHLLPVDPSDSDDADSSIFHSISCVEHQQF